LRIIRHSLSMNPITFTVIVFAAMVSLSNNFHYTSPLDATVISARSIGGGDRRPQTQHEQEARL
ncbi:MAG: hypothetical protein ABTR27_04940, partial [Candidatus Competibacter phosphatis]